MKTAVFPLQDLAFRRFSKFRKVSIARFTDFLVPVKNSPAEFSRIPSIKSGNVGDSLRAMGRKMET